MSTEVKELARAVEVLVPGFIEPLSNGKYRAGGSVVLITGWPLIVVDTGAAEQRGEILDALASRGVRGEDVGWVINTHGHIDHIGNNNLFPDATFVLGSDNCRRGEYWMHDFAGPLLIPSDYGPAVEVVRTAGHTNHDLSVLVPTSQGITAVVGDLFEYADDANDDAWKAWSEDVDLQRASRERILGIASVIVPGHGPPFLVKA